MWVHVLASCLECGAINLISCCFRWRPSTWTAAPLFYDLFRVQFLGVDSAAGVRTFYFVVIILAVFCLCVSQFVLANSQVTRWRLAGSRLAPVSLSRMLRGKYAWIQFPHVAADSISSADDVICLSLAHPVARQSLFNRLGLNVGAAQCITSVCLLCICIQRGGREGAGHVGDYTNVKP